MDYAHPSHPKLSVASLSSSPRPDQDPDPKDGPPQQPQPVTDSEDLPFKETSQTTAAVKVKPAVKPKQQMQTQTQTQTGKRTQQGTDHQDPSLEPVKKRQDSRSATHTPPGGQFSSQVTLGFVPCPQEDPEDVSNTDFSISQGIHDLPIHQASPMMEPFSGPVGRHELDQKTHSLGEHDFAEAGENSPIRQQLGRGGGAYSHVGTIGESAGSSDTMAHASSSSHTYSPIVLLDDDENAPSPHISNQQPSSFSPPVGQVKIEENSATSISGQPSLGLTLISNEDFHQSGQAEGEVQAYAIITPPSTGTSGGVLSDETWTQPGQATTSSGGLVPYTPAQYQHQAQVQQTSFGTLIQQPQQPHTTQPPLPGVKEIAGFYQSVPLPESPMLDRSHYALGPQGAHHAPAQYMELYNAAHYTAPPGMGLLPMPHPYPVPMGFQEIPMARRRRDRRHHQAPYGTSNRHDPQRQQPSGVKAEGPSSANELLESPSMTVRSEPFKHENDTTGSEGPQSHRRHEIQDRDPDPKACNNCQTTTTPSWRRCPKGRILLCNACGLYQKLHGKSRPHYLAKDGTIKVQRIVPEHAPCVQCHTRTSPTWKKGPKGEAVCHACSTTMKLGRSQSKSKVTRMIEYPSPADMLSVVSEGMYSGDPSGAEYSEAMAMRWFHSHGLGDGAGDLTSTSSPYGDVEGAQRRPRSSSTRHSTRAVQQSGYLVDHSSRSGVNQYQGNRPVVYGFGQVGPAYGLAQYGSYDTSGYSLTSLQATYPTSPGEWQPDISAQDSGSYGHGAGSFTLDSSPPQQGQFQQQREAASLLRMDSSPSALPASNQSSLEGQQLLVPFNRPTQASYVAWGQTQQTRVPQPSLHSTAWSAGGNGGGAGPAMNVSSNVGFSPEQQQQQQQHRMFLINQRSGSANSRQDLLSQGLSHFATTATSNEAAAVRQDRHQFHQAQQQAHQQSLMHHKLCHPQQPYALEHAYHSVCGQQQQHHQASHACSSYPASIPVRSRSPSQDQKNRDYEAALQSYVQAGGSDDASMPAHSSTMGASTVDDTVEQSAGATPAGSDSSLNKDPSSSSSGHKNPIDGPHSSDHGDEIAKSESNLEAMAAETLANTFFDRQNSTANASSPVPESGSSSRSVVAAPATTAPETMMMTTTTTTAHTPVVVTEVKKQKKSPGSGIMDIEGKTSLTSLSSLLSHKSSQQQHGGSTAPFTSAPRSASRRNASTSMVSAIPEETKSYEGGSDCHHPRRSERNRPTSTSAGATSATSATTSAVAPKSVKKQEGLMSQYLNRRH
ncbi:Transcription factor GATA-6 [Linnemannia elongata]|nr:Transcription factor GATA-6 [Linnemannia elongata]